MCLRTRLIGQLASARGGAGSGSAPWTARLFGDHTQCELEFARLEQLAAEVNWLRVTWQSPTRWLPEDLRRVAQRIAAQVAYLLEPLGPVELDQEAATLLMRSTTPSQEDPNRRAYYELLVRSGELSLRRYETLSGSPRRLIPMVLSVEVLARLVSDLDGAN